MLGGNTAVEKGLAKGTRGTLVGFEKDPREGAYEGKGEWKLKYMPRWLWFKPERPRHEDFPSTPSGVVPLKPGVLNGKSSTVMITPKLSSVKHLFPKQQKDRQLCSLGFRREGFCLRPAVVRMFVCLALQKSSYPLVRP